MGKDTKSGEVPKGKQHIIVKLIEYTPDSVVSKTILRKSTGNVTAMSFAEGEELGEKTSPYDTYVQIIDGAAELVMNKKKFQLKVGEGIVIAANSIHCFNANQQFKMISTVIKSGYEDLSLEDM